MNNKNLIQFHKGGIDWKSAIKLGVSLLEQNDIATNELADAIIKSTIDMGPYYIVSDKVALAHTQFGDYNKKVGMSLVIFETPVKFSDQKKHEVNLLFTLSATDANSHMSLIQNFANVFSDLSITNKILQEKNIDEIYKIFKEVI